MRFRCPSRWWLGSVGFALVVAVVGNCDQDARLAGARLRVPTVQDVTVAGITLDADSSPEVVTYALLQAIRADLAADDDREARDLAFDQQVDLSAPSAIHRHHIRSIGEAHSKLDESVYKSVRSWAPTLGHYVDSFDFPVEELEARTRTRIVPPSSNQNHCQTEERHVLLEAADPGGDPNASVVVKVRLVQEQDRWRVWWVGFERSIRHLPAATAQSSSTAEQSPS
ncbi:MAG: hypothetical protein GY842_00425 [bacterium]|nr:hypothetical protein [bacterium]